ncbi:hypothetical protein LP316_14200 [Thalassotalea sp. LPB0316]|uniref:hypothetical protein n=1 Tax=Thalassotalea sp. LPB0316 TaxID=2769490 RepID=UPI0018694B65|nr:hypothetical protein [Thalassotalea sp. LPB0316]QOL25431.1 hypothetical protein LP316_14200 [Thalassotalea sp. LPB0316]
MKQFNRALTSLVMVALSGFATVQAQDYNLDFGLVLHNDIGEPVGFEKTNEIPLTYNGEPALYGLVVTNDDNTPFTLSSVHILPADGNDKPRKLMGKPMYIQKRGAVFMRTDIDDVVGVYQMEIYLDNVLYKTITYQITDNAIQLAQIR